MSTGLSTPSGDASQQSQYALDPFAGVNLEHLEKSLMRPRTFFDMLANTVVTGMTALALVPLFSVLLMLVVRGRRRLSLAAVSTLPPVALEHGGGFGNPSWGRWSSWAWPDS